MDPFVDNFVKTHRRANQSPALVAYKMFTDEKLDSMLDEMLATTVRTPEEKVIEEQIMAADNAGLLKFMRKKMAGILKFQLQRRLLEHQDEVMEELKEKSVATLNDNFVENALFFFAKCKENPHDWIRAEYDNFRSEYFKSMLCVILGIRGEQRDIFKLIKEAERFEEDFPNELFDQGPYIAVMELADKYIK